jgi:hypothetical protein
MPPALAGLVVGLAYAAISVYWAVGGRWLLNTVGISLSQPGQAGHLAGLLAVWGAAAVKAVAAVLPLLAIVVWPRTANGALRRPARVLTWIEAAILVGYGLVPTASGLLLQAGVIKAAAHADRLALKWHAYLWDPWFLIWGIFVFLALWRSRPEVGGRSTGMPRITSGPCRMGAHITARFHPHATFGRRPGPASAPSVLGEGNTHPAAGQEPLPSGRPARQVRPVRAPTPAGPHWPAFQTNEVILMTATQSTQRHGATVRRAARRAAAALRAIHDEQVLMWELAWQSSRVPVDRAGPLAWTPSLDGPG